MGAHGAKMQQCSLGLKESVPSRIRKSSIGVNWDDQPLGRVPDRELARSLGVTQQTVTGVRRRRGIKPFIASHLGDGKSKNAKRRRRKQDAKRLASKGTLGRVYFIGCGPEFVKIGWTSKAVEARLIELQAANPHRLSILAVIEEQTPWQERDLHRKFAALRVSRDCEWFRMSAEIACFIGRH